MARRTRQRRNSPRNQTQADAPRSSPPVRAPGRADPDRRRTRRSQPAPRGNVFSVAREIQRHEREFSQARTPGPPQPVSDPDVAKGRAEPDTPAPKARPTNPDALTLERLDTCKSKPTKTKGSGGSRPFVPWCKK